MIVYQVELELAVALRDEYLAWLHEHVQAMVSLPGFLGGEILQRTEPSPPAGQCVFCVQYRLRDHLAWDGYLANHAATMRAAGVARFGARVTATRRLLETL